MTNPIFATRLPKKLVKHIVMEKEKHHRTHQTTVTLALERYFALPVEERLQLTAKRKGGSK